MTFGWSIEAATIDSRRKRSRKRRPPGVLGQDQLEGDRALERELLGPVDDAHVAVADDLLDAAPGEDRARRRARRRAAPRWAAGPVGRGCGRRPRGRRRRRSSGGGAAAAGGGAGGERRRRRRGSGARWRSRRRRGSRGGGAAAASGAAGVRAGCPDPPAPASSGRLAPSRPPAARAARARRTPFTNVPFADPRSSIVSRPAASRAHARVAARQLGDRRPASPLRSPRARSRARRRASSRRPLVGADA